MTITYTYLDRSAQFSRKFFILDKMLGELSEWLTFEEVDHILKQMDLRTKSKLEGNWSMSDSIDFLKQTLGSDRYDVLRNLWIMGRQETIMEHTRPEELREICINKITLHEATPDEYRSNPDGHVFFKVLK